jgi:hypothetical protein
MRMWRRTATLAIAMALGTGAAIGVGACGEERKGEVKFEGDAGTETAGTSSSTAAETATETNP